MLDGIAPSGIEERMRLMKLWHAVFAGLLGLASASGVAEAQWSSDRAPAWRDDARVDARLRGFDGAVDGRGIGERWPGRSGGRLARAADALAFESARLADTLHAIAPGSRVARGAMGVALRAERFERGVDAGAPRGVTLRQLRALTREVTRLVAITGGHPRHRSPGLGRQLERLMDALQVARAELGRGALERWDEGATPYRAYPARRAYY